MPFMDHLSKIAKSVGDTAQSAAKKSAEMLEVTKLNMSIQSEQDKIKAVKSEIGDIVFKKFSQGLNIEADLLEACGKITALQQNIDAIHKKIAELKNIKLCSTCGAELELNTVFCPKCGSKQAELEFIQQESVEAVQKKLCPECTAEITGDSAFCTSCGKKLTE